MQAREEAREQAYKYSEHTRYLASKHENTQASKYASTVRRQASKQT